MPTNERPDIDDNDEDDGQDDEDEDDDDNDDNNDNNRNNEILIIIMRKKTNIKRTCTFHTAIYFDLFALWPTFHETKQQIAKRGRNDKKYKNGPEWPIQNLNGIERPCSPHDFVFRLNMEFWACGGLPSTNWRPGKLLPLLGLGECLGCWLRHEKAVFASILKLRSGNVM